MIFLSLLFTFFQIGLFTFGGGYAMIPLIMDRVTAHGWLATEELVDFIAVAESTPGPFAINIATYVGSETAGLLGSVCATLGVVLPSFLIILIVAKFYTAFRGNKYVEGALTGLRPVVVGLIAATVLSVGQTVFFGSGLTLSSLLRWETLIALVIFAVMLTVLLYRKWHPILIVLLSALIGIGAGCAGWLGTV